MHNYIDLIKKRFKIKEIFTKKNQKILSVIVVVVALVSIGFLLFNTLGKEVIANLGETVRLEVGKTLQIKNKNVFVKITKFDNEPCPSGVECIWSGQSINYEITADNKKYSADSSHSENDSPYIIYTFNSDYKTYVDIKILAK